MEYILQPWPWYVSGPLIALVMLILVFFGKTFGMSSNLQTLCSIGGAGKYSDYFRFDWKAQRWNLTVVLGAVLGGFIATQSNLQLPSLIAVIGFFIGGLIMTFFILPLIFGS